MPSAEYTTTIQASREAVWDFVKDMDNWAPFLSGYQKHTRISDTESIWLLKGNLGGLTRVAEFRVVIIEWAAPERVSFKLQGVNESMSGSGSFQSSPSTVVSVATPSAPKGEGSSAPQRFWQGLWRALFRVIFRKSGQTAVGKPQGMQDLQTTVTFRLSLSVGGASGKIIDLLMAPLLRPTAEDLMKQITHAIEAPRVTQTATGT